MGEWMSDDDPQSNERGLCVKSNRRITVVLKDHSSKVKKKIKRTSGRWRLVVVLRGITTYLPDRVSLVPFSLGLFPFRAVPFSAEAASNLDFWTCRTSVTGLHHPQPSLRGSSIAHLPAFPLVCRSTPNPHLYL